MNKLVRNEWADPGCSEHGRVQTVQYLLILSHSASALKPQSDRGCRRTCMAETGLWYGD